MATYSRQSNIVFYHIPKCTGLFIENVLLDRIDFVTYNFTEGSEIPFYWNCDISIREAFHTHAAKFCISPRTLPSLFEFTFVRNPYTRFISAFFYCKGKKLDSRCRNPCGDAFMNSLQECIRDRELCYPKTYFHIFKTQYQNVKKEGKPLDFIGRCENLHLDLRMLLKKLNLDSGYSRAKINESPIPYGDYRQYYTLEILEFVNSWFDEDFLVFGYNKVTSVEDLPPA